MSRRITYASAEESRLRLAERRAALLANIHERQRQARLLSEIGAEFGSLPVVRAVLMEWLLEAAA
jgi:hypothetical protein